MVLKSLALVDNIEKAEQFSILCKDVSIGTVKILITPYKKQNFLTSLKYVFWVFKYIIFNKKFYLFMLLLKGIIIIKKDPLKSTKTIKWIKEKNFDIGLHAMNIIYKNNIIHAFNMGILNAHIGVLPHYRGRCVMEWGVLEGGYTGVSTFFIDEDIDTGEKIIDVKTIPINNFDNTTSAKNHLFSHDIFCYKKALGHLYKDKNFFLIKQQRNDGTRYYQMSDFLKFTIDRYLKNE